MVTDQCQLFGLNIDIEMFSYGEKTMFIRKFVLSLMLIALTVGVGVAVAQDAPKELRFGTLEDPNIDSRATPCSSSSSTNSILIFL